MPVLIQVGQLNKSYGPDVILDDATASFSSDQKIGVIGRNGAGKSTLCRIITGHEKADSGKVIFNSALKLSYLEQHDTFLPDETVLDYLTRSSGAEGWQCGQTAAMFQIDNEMLSAPVKKLAGGYQTRVKLTSMLLKEPNFLILDEPSNYLDLSTLILLENFLVSFRGGYLVVSHDREFLKKTCDHTLEVEAGKLTLYPGSIEEYFEFKEEQIALKEAHNQNIMKKRDQLESFISRFRAKASTASRAQSKMKQLEKLKTIEIGHEAGNVRIRIPQTESRAGVAFSCENLAIGYPDKEVARNIHFDVDRGQRVAVLGDNGQGKTTFLKTVTGGLKPKEGTFKWGTHIKLAYYAQHVFSTLNEMDTVFAHLMRECADGVTEQDVLNMAGCFLFKGDDVKKKVSVLSGGERARLILAGLLLSKSQVLLLDEPTNHLDFETVEALGHALQHFSGTVFLICHDRTFVNMVATSILEVKDGNIMKYPGSYEDYVYHLECVAKGEKEETDSEKSSSSSKASKGANVDKSGNDELKQIRAEEKKRKNELAKLERALSKAEQRLNHHIKERDKLMKEMKDNPFHFSRDRNERLKQVQINLEAAEDEWCSLQEQHEKMKAQ